MFKMSHIILAFVSNITNAIHDDKDFIKNSPYLIDSLLFINTRILMPFVLNTAELSDPLYRTRNQLYRMNKSLKELYKINSSSYKIDDKFYVKCLTKFGKYDSISKHMILNNFSKLLKIGNISDE